MKKKQPFPGLDKRIDYTPVEIKLEDTFPTDKHAAIRRLDDEKFIIDQSGINYIFLGLGILGIIILTGGFFLDGSLLDKIFLFIIFLTPLFMLLKSTIGSKKVFIFDRKAGMVTFPGLVWGTSKTLPFDQVRFIKMRVGPYVGESFHLAILRPDGVTRTVISMDKAEKFLSLFVWYMDKNRPLPPGTAFDPYRERDYERRKSEGFPPPLYPGRIETPDIGPDPDRYSQKPKRRGRKKTV